MSTLTNIWTSLRSNPVFVAAYSAALGALASTIQDELVSGQVDWSRAGISKLAGFALTAAVAAVIHLYAPVPKSK